MFLEILLLTKAGSLRSASVTLNRQLFNQPCPECKHSRDHTGGGIGICLHPGCGCDGPMSEMAKDLIRRIDLKHDTITELERRLDQGDKIIIPPRTIPLGVVIPTD